MILEKYSMGVGDRFGYQGKAQLKAVQAARAEGIPVVPVWNKSHREHTIIGSTPADVRREADAAVRALDWSYPYHVDADHIGIENVDLFIDSSDFFTLDVADFTGEKADTEQVDAFVQKTRQYTGALAIPGVDQTFRVTEEDVRSIAEKYLLAVREAARIYRHIAERKTPDMFVTEVSMDETDTPQTPVEMFFILAAIAAEDIPAQTVAPKFSGRFNKGVDYVGDVETFTREFEQDLAVIEYAKKEFGLPASLKLSVHSGSDKFSIYGPIREALIRHDAGLHVKTAGTTWLEEIIGLAAAGGAGLEIARTIYEDALSRYDELCGPYASVIDIERGNLPDPEMVRRWSGEQFAHALTHDQDCPDFNPDFRQLLHVAYKVAAEMGSRYTAALEAAEDVVAESVKENILERHIRRIFPAGL